MMTELFARAIDTLHESVACQHELRMQLGIMCVHRLASYCCCCSVHTWQVRELCTLLLQLAGHVKRPLAVLLGGLLGGPVQAA